MRPAKRYELRAGKFCVYFSVTGNKTVAKMMQKSTKGRLYKINPSKPYIKKI
ncbi:MAG: hypothetical protein ACLT2Z_00640 [Eubacterium sp.]